MTERGLVKFAGRAALAADSAIRRFRADCRWAGRCRYYINYLNIEVSGGQR